MEPTFPHSHVPTFSHVQWGAMLRGSICLLEILQVAHDSVAALLRCYAQHRQPSGRWCPFLAAAQSRCSLPISLASSWFASSIADSITLR